MGNSTCEGRLFKHQGAQNKSTVGKERRTQAEPGGEGEALVRPVDAAGDLKGEKAGRDSKQQPQSLEGTVL